VVARLAAVGPAGCAPVAQDACGSEVPGFGVGFSFESALLAPDGGGGAAGGHLSREQVAAKGTSALRTAEGFSAEVLAAHQEHQELSDFYA
jgi:hypothetical protein